MSTLAGTSTYVLPTFSDIKVGTLNDKPLPVVLTPLTDAAKTKSYLVNFCTVNREALLELMYQRKVILFRGFELPSPQDFEEVALACEPKLSNEYLGTSPRNFVEGTKYVFTASELPNFFPIPQHIEMSFLNSRPDKVFFYCQSPPSGSVGGETPVADCAAIWQQLHPKVKAKFEQKGVRYHRNYGGPTESTLDPTQLKRWPEIFGSSDKKLVAESCQRDQVTLEWKKGDGIRLTNNMAAYRKHPQTGEEIWSNHANVFHPAMIHQEYYRIARSTGQWRLYLLALFGLLLFTLKWLFKKQQDFPLNTLYGDGSVISSSDMSHVRDTIWRNTVFNRWQQGDMLLIDNLAASHGRMPYSGKDRRILVAWG